MAVGLAAVVLGRSIRKPGFASNQDPGPQFFPELLGFILALCGIFWVLKSFQSIDKDSEVTGGTSSNRTLLLFIGGLAAYLLAMPWVGFSIASCVFVYCMIWLQGSRWFLALPLSVGLVAGIQLLFGSLFHVQLPSGVLGLPF